MTIGHGDPGVGVGIERDTGPDAGRGARRLGGPTAEEVWRAVARSSFAVVGHLTPTGEPRSSGVVYKTLGRRMYVAVAPESWKARHIAANGRVTVTVTVRRGGILSLVFPIPPATISFRGTARVLGAGSPQARSALEKLTSLLPREGRDSASIIEIAPRGAFVTYGIGVPLMKMRDPVLARARVPVMREP
jgi:hypothetical protein